MQSPARAARWCYTRSINSRCGVPGGYPDRVDMVQASVNLSDESVSSIISVVEGFRDILDHSL